MDKTLEDRIDDAYKAWTKRWAEERKNEPEAVHRYSISFTCDKETFEAVLSAVKGFVVADRSWRYMSDDDIGKGLEWQQGERKN